MNECSAEQFVKSRFGEFVRITESFEEHWHHILNFWIAYNLRVNTILDRFTSPNFRRLEFAAARTWG